MRPAHSPLLALCGPLATTGLIVSMVGCANLTAPSRNESAPAPTPTQEQAQQARPTPSPAPAPAEAEEKIAASHILVGFTGAMRARSKRSKEEAQKLASQIAARAKKGEDFAELAKKHSEGPSAPRGGQLNEFSRQQMVKPFADAAFALKVGQISDPVETPFGFHIIKRTK